MDDGEQLPVGDQSPPAANRIVYNWSDITTDFVDACSDLQLGQLLHDDYFGLLEAMSAIEMMDPKMDAGMLCNQRSGKLRSLQHGIETGAVKVEALSYSELIAIMDDTFACLVTWLEGHSLAQTIFINLYLHDPHAIEDCTLKAFVICVLRIVATIRDRINRAAVFEEEDFQSMTYGFKMAGDVTDMRASGMVREVEDDLNRTIKMTREKEGKERDEATQNTHHLAVAVYSRLKFTRTFLASLLAFNKGKGGIAETQKCLSQMSELLTSMTQTVHLGVGSESRTQQQSVFPAVMGFEPLVNQRLLPPTFPRYTCIKQRDETFHYLSELLARLRTVCCLADVSGLHQLLDFFLQFSQLSPDVLSRSLLQLSLLPQNRRVFGTQPMLEAVKETIRAFIAPPALAPKGALSNNVQTREYVDTFLSHAAPPITSMFQITGHNRARQRDKWRHLLEELAALQDEGDKLDTLLHTLLTRIDPPRAHLACFGTWVLYHTLCTMIHYCLAGFELGLYALHEYHYVYWYLYECLYSWLISALSRADSFMLEQDAITEQQKGRASKRGRKKKKLRVHLKEATMAQGAQSLCEGYYKAVTGFTMSGKLRQPKFDFDSEEVRYSHRFAPFGCLVTPPLVQYAQFKDGTDLSDYEPAVQPEDMYLGSCKCFQQARSCYECITNPSPEVQNLIKIAKTNFVVMKLLLGGHKKDSMDLPEFDFSMSSVFPVIKIT